MLMATYCGVSKTLGMSFRETCFESKSIFNFLILFYLLRIQDLCHILEGATCDSN